MSGWHVYVLRCRDGTLYTGIAIDLGRRLEAHRRGAAAKYTRGRRPVDLVYQESQPDRSSALKREAALRRLGRAGKSALIAPRRMLGGKIASGESRASDGNVTYELAFKTGAAEKEDQD